MYILAEISDYNLQLKCTSGHPAIPTYRVLPYSDNNNIIIHKYNNYIRGYGRKWPPMS